MSDGIVKRKRGRPRRDEPREINNFDLMLIQEFRKRRAFYDHEHPQYKNKPELERLWAEMARTTGYGVQLVKTRVLQLRNRYNLEKRRVEGLRGQYNDPSVTSPWHLYNKLNFLNEHIRSRRSFIQNVSPLHPKKPPPSSSSNNSEEEEEDTPLAESSNVVALPTAPIQNHSMITRRSYQKLINGNTSRDVKNPVQPSGEQCPNGFPASSSPYCRGSGRRCGCDGATNVDKYKAFGQFLASSLMDLNEKEALELVEKFTSDIVRCLAAELSTT